MEVYARRLHVYLNVIRIHKACSTTLAFLAFKYWAEWNDAFNPLTGETEGIQGEVFDNDNNAWQPKLTSGFSPVFNGRLSGLIDLIHEMLER